MEYYIAINKKGLTLSQKIRRDFYKVLTSEKTTMHKRYKKYFLKITNNLRRIDFCEFIVNMNKEIDMESRENSLIKKQIKKRMC